jgi:hypothetical protein
MVSLPKKIFFSQYRTFAETKLTGFEGGEEAFHIQSAVCEVS